MNVLKSINKNKKNVTLLTGFIHSLTGRRWAGSSQTLLCLQTVRKCITNAMIDDLIETTFRGEEITVSYTKTTIKKIIMWWHTPKSSCASDQAVQKTKLLFDIPVCVFQQQKAKKKWLNQLCSSLHTLFWSILINWFEILNFDSQLTKEWQVFRNLKWACHVLQVVVRCERPSVNNASQIAMVALKTGSTISNKPS